MLLILMVVDLVHYMQEKHLHSTLTANHRTSLLQSPESRELRNAVLEVRNRTESPVDAGDLEHVFERFYRTDRSRSSETGGHGIGLSMASAIVNAHGGKIKAGTTDGSDFVITASLPLAN